MSQEAPRRSVEELLASGPPTEWYSGYGRTDTGITGMNYSSVFNRLVEGEVRRHMGDWSHFGISVHLGIARPTRRIQRILARSSAEVRRLSGFSPDDISEKRIALLDAFQGQKNAPFEVHLVEPLSIPAQPPSLDWFMAFARHDRGILRITYKGSLYALEGGEVGRQMESWHHYMENPITEKDDEERKRRFMEATLYAGHYVKAVTGYYPSEWQARRVELDELYVGQEYAPLEIEYVDD